MKKQIFFLLPVLIATSTLYAQSLPATLLWKISGNGLQHPSYLYGTIHLSDEKIFNIGDSVYKAIENSAGFAIEIDPEQLTPFVIDETKKSILEARQLKKMISDETFKKYGKALAKKLNKSEDEITTTDILEEKNKWIEESYKTGTMQTFLDIYLFDIARRQGKWTGGVEDLQDQENVMDYLVDESDLQELVVEEDKSKKRYNEELDQLVKLYLNGDLDAIREFTTPNDSVYEEAVLTRRNKKMAMRMDSLSHERSMVFAIGAAHLPGEEGLISLLKQKGFTVSPVFSSKKIKHSDYKVADISLPWYEVNDESGYYKASMPGKAGDLTLYGILNMKMYFDVFTSTLYMTGAFRTPYSATVADSLFDGMVTYYFDEKRYNEGKPVTINGVPGKEFISDKDRFTHGYLLYQDGVMYMAIGMGMKKDSATKASINKFMNSYVILEHNANVDQSYFTYTDKTGAYQVDLPAKPNSVNDYANTLSGDSSFHRDIQIVSDPQTGAYLFFGKCETNPGYYVVNDSEALAKIKAAQTDRFSVVLVDTMYRDSDNLVMHVQGVMSEAPLTMKSYFQAHGNTYYALIAMYDSTKPNPSVERFFTSFKTLGHPEHEWQEYAADDTLFHTWAPSKFMLAPANETQWEEISAEYISFDTSRADSYELLVAEPGKYFWQNGDSALWEHFVDEAVSFNDTLLARKKVANGEASGVELTIREHGSGNVARKRILLNNDRVYTLLTIKSESELYTNNTNRFFEDFRFNKTTASSAIFTSKASLLLRDLSNGDSAIREAARAALHDAPFTNKDLPLLHAALMHDYPVSEYYYDDPKQSLKGIIIDIHDTSSYSFALTNYLNADKETKNLLLEIMASFPSQEHFADLKTILFEHPPKQQPEYSFAYAFADSIQLAASVFPGFLPLLKDTVLAPTIVRIARHLLDSNLISASLLEPYQPDILVLSRKQYSAIKNDPGNYDYVNYSIVYLLEKMNNATCNSELQKWSLLKNADLELEVVSALLRNEQALNSRALQQAAEDKYTRTDLYDSLRAYKKESLYPKQYLTQKNFAESYAFKVASDDDEPSDITFLTQRVIDFKGKRSRFFFFKVAYGENDEAYYSLACAGPFDENSAALSAGTATGDIYYDDDFDAENQEEQMDALIKQMERWYEWPEKKAK